MWTVSLRYVHPEFESQLIDLPRSRPPSLFPFFLYPKHLLFRLYNFFYFIFLYSRTKAVGPWIQRFYIILLTVQLQSLFMFWIMMELKLCSLTCHWITVSSYTLKGRRVPPNRVGRLTCIFLHPETQNNLWQWRAHDYKSQHGSVCVDRQKAAVPNTRNLQDLFNESLAWSSR